MPTKVFAFTTRANRKLNVLTNEVGIAEPRNASRPEHQSPPDKFKAIWDTGATNSAVSKRVVVRCSLQPTGVVEVHTPGGISLHNTYMVSIFLPNRVVIPEIRVTECEFGDEDVSIGMDIIGQGDFAVTNLGGKTVFTFRIPSLECLDFVRQIRERRQVGAAASPKIGRNAPCPCGSGKKFKNCCIHKR